MTEPTIHELAASYARIADQAELFMWQYEANMDALVRAATLRNAKWYYWHVPVERSVNRNVPIVHRDVS